MNLPFQIYCDYLEDKGFDCRLLRTTERLGNFYVSVPNHDHLRNNSNTGDGYCTRTYYYGDGYGNGEYGDYGTTTGDGYGCTHRNGNGWGSP